MGRWSEGGGRRPWILALVAVTLSTRWALLPEPAKTADGTPARS